MSGLPTVRDMLADGRVHLMDGAMGTVLYDRGVFLNVCYDELSETNPALIAAIHQEYIDAGAELIETNTFGANPVKLSGFGLDGRTEALNRSAAELAVRAAAGRARVLGAVGPLGIRIEPWGPTSAEEARAFFRRQIHGLVQGGVDAILLETFQDPEELHQALAAAREASDLPVITLVSVEEGGRTTYGAEVESVVRSLDAWGSDAVGFNCSVGPAEILEALERAAEVTSLPLVALPNAGLPRTVGDRKMYLASPDYMARYARRMIQAGVRFLGGCCGTTPEHILRMAELVRSVDGGSEVGDPKPGGPVAAVSVRAGATAAPARERGGERAGTGSGVGAGSGPGAGNGSGGALPAPLAERSAFGKALAGGHFVLSVELVPPSGWDATGFIGDANQLREAGVGFATVPDSPRGRTRMGALPAATLLAGTEGIEVIAQYACRDRNMIGMISDLMGAAASGVRNVVLVTGDPPPTGPYPDRTAIFDIDSIGLTNVVHHLNRGEEPGGRRVTPPTRFVIGVALNPGAADPELEDRRFRYKVEAGADFALSQPVFDAGELDAFLARHPEHRIPVIAGIWPLVSVENAEFLANEVPEVRVPAAVISRMRRAETRGGPPAAREEGIRVAVEAVEALGSRVHGIHVSAPPGRLDLALEVIERVRAGRSRADPR